MAGVESSAEILAPIEKGCFIVRDKHDNVERCSLFENEIIEVVLTSGNAVYTGALASWLNN